ncbi:hypothetical protein Vadar_020489 [Vaccinium darrowii]|uniref:Uncharacterized protein n=1 Tax=Vaccinium darrowii TaxID=229202 RepID=A0ACB7Z6M8_9ERIC|nr:hypothetical protein Vadar_020489 [Vaccinium darrowii]
MALKCAFLLFAMTCFYATTAGARDVPLSLQPGFNLTARLESGGSALVECWNAMSEIKSCSNEIILYFMNGATDIGPACCNAIDMITRHCWPAMLTALGYTAEETNILRGYCDATSSSGGGGPAPSPHKHAKHSRRRSKTYVELKSKLKSRDKGKSQLHSPKVAPKSKLFVPGLS